MSQWLFDTPRGSYTIPDHVLAYDSGSWDPQAQPGAWSLALVKGLGGTNLRVNPCIPPSPAWIDPESWRAPLPQCAWCPPGGLLITGTQTNDYGGVDGWYIKDPPNRTDVWYSAYISSDSAWADACGYVHYNDVPKCPPGVTRQVFEEPITYADYTLTSYYYDAPHWSGGVYIGTSPPPNYVKGCGVYGGGIPALFGNATPAPQVLQTYQELAAARQPQMKPGYMWAAIDWQTNVWPTIAGNYAAGEERYDAAALGVQNALITQGLNPSDPTWVQAWNIMQAMQDRAMKANADAAHGFVNILEALPIIAAPLMAFFAAEILPGILASFAPAEGATTAQTIASGVAEAAPGTPGASEIFQVAKTFANVAAQGNPQLKGALSLVGSTVSFGTALVNVTGVTDLAGGGIAATDELGNLYTLDASGTSITSATDATGLPLTPDTGAAAMPVGQFDDYSYDYSTDLGLDTGNLGYDVPYYDDYTGDLPLDGTPQVDGFGDTGITPDVIEPVYDPGALTGTVDTTASGDLTGTDFGELEAVGSFQSSGGWTDPDSGVTYYYDDAGNVVSAVDVNGAVYDLDAQGNWTAGGTITDVSPAIDHTAPIATQMTQASTASGFSLDSIAKLVGMGLSVFGAVQKLQIDKARAERGLPPTGTRGAQTRTVRDTRTGQLVTQMLNPLTGQWQTVGPAPAGAAVTGGGLSQPIAGVPLWGWLAGGGLLLFALSDRRRGR